MDRARALLAGIGILGLLSVMAGLLFFVQTKDPIVLFMALIALNWLLVVVAAVHVLARDDLAGLQRLLWLAIVVLVTPGFALGAAVYLGLGVSRTRELFRDVATPAPRAEDSR